MKKFFNIIGICTAILFIFGIKYLSDAQTNTIDPLTNYETELFKTASMYTFDSAEIEPIKNISTITVDEITAEIYGYNYRYDIEYSNNELEDMTFPGLPSENTTPKHDLSHLEYFDLTYAQKNKIASAKEKIHKLIDDFSILSSKTFLKECISDVEFKLVKSPELFEVEDSSNELVALFYEGTIYINKNKQDYFFEHTAVHELLHVLRHLTYYGNSDWNLDVPYAGLPFDEGMTEILTYATNPYLPSNVNGYKDYTPNLYRYLNTFKQDALSAYFYGYNSFFEKYGGETFKIEHEAFSASFSGYTTEFVDLMNIISIQILNKMNQDSNL